MNLPAVRDQQQVPQLDVPVLEVIRGHLNWRVSCDRRLTLFRRIAAFREINALIKHERRRRDRLANMQAQLGHCEEELKLQLRNDRIRNQIRLARAEHARAIARIQSDIANFYYEALEKQKSMRLTSGDDWRDELRQAELELARMAAKDRVNRRREQMRMRSLRRQALAKGQFIQYVRKHFPDLAEELIVNYEQHQYREGV